MAKSLIQTVNSGPQTVSNLGVIGLGTTSRRFGCNLRQNGDAIECSGCGYYTVTASVVVSPDTAGIVSVEMQQGGAPVSGAISSAAVSTADNPATLTIVSTIRLSCDETGTLTFILAEGEGIVENISVRVEKA